MGLQSAINTALATTAVAGHIAGQQKAAKVQEEALKKAESKEIESAKIKLEDEALKHEGFSEDEINKFHAYQAGITEPTDTEKGEEIRKQFDLMKSRLASNVYNSEAFAKMQMDAAFRQRILDLKSGSMDERSKLESLIDEGAIQYKRGGKR